MMSSEVTRVLDEVAPVLDPAPLRDALRAWEALPWRVAVVGRLGVGKSTLVNLLAGDRVRPTGLGGVSVEEADVDVGGTRVVDTVGIDDEASALDRLQPLLEDVDAVVWVVDGLQPMTATERRVLDASLVPGTPLHVVVSKLDLADDHEPDLVLERVRTLATKHRPLSVRRLDLRRATEPPTDLLAWASSPRRLRPVRSALDRLQAALDALPPAETREQVARRVRERWAARVRSAEKRVEERIADGHIENKVDALAHLVVVGDELRARFVVELAADEVLGTLSAPELPSPERPDAAPLRKVVASMSGIEGARRVLRSAAARWLAEGELALIEWLERLEGLDERHQARARAQDALSRARLAV